MQSPWNFFSSFKVLFHFFASFAALQWSASPAFADAKDDCLHTPIKDVIAHARSAKDMRPKLPTCGSSSDWIKNLAENFEATQSRAEPISIHCATQPGIPPFCSGGQHRLLSFLYNNPNATLRDVPSSIRSITLHSEFPPSDPRKDGSGYLYYMAVEEQKKPTLGVLFKQHFPGR